MKKTYQINYYSENVRLLHSETVRLEDSESALKTYVHNAIMNKRFEKAYLANIITAESENCKFEWRRLLDF